MRCFNVKIDEFLCVKYFVVPIRLLRFEEWRVNEMKAIKTETNALKPVSPGFIGNIVRHRYAYILLLPAMIVVFLFCYLPLAGIVLAFKDFNIYDGFLGSPWVGLDNFKLIFQQRSMLLAIKNTLVLSILTIFGGFPFPIILAILFNEIRNMKFKKVVQTVSYMPHFLSWASVIGLLYSFFALGGPVNQILGMIFGEGYVAKNFLMDSSYFLPIAFWSNLWKTVGWNSVLYLAAIAGIDPSLYEAATIDGAGKFKQMWHITLSGIKTTAVIVLVMNMGSLFSNNFELVYGLQNVYTIDDTEVINTLIYRSGIQNGNYSAATAFGLAQGLITVILILTANAVSKKVADVSLW